MRSGEGLLGICDCILEIPTPREECTHLLTLAFFGFDKCIGVNLTISMGLYALVLLVACLEISEASTY